VTQTRTEAPSARAASAGRGGRLGRFIREVISEMRKVLWPSRNELVTYTIVVIIFVVVMVSIVAGLDVGFAKLVLQVFG
jgi:preprotein translocase subunit SecE